MAVTSAAAVSLIIRSSVAKHDVFYVKIAPENSVLAALRPLKFIYCGPIGPHPCFRGPEGLQMLLCGHRPHKENPSIIRFGNTCCIASRVLLYVNFNLYVACARDYYNSWIPGRQQLEIRWGKMLNLMPLKGHTIICWRPRGSPQNREWPFWS